MLKGQSHTTNSVRIRNPVPERRAQQFVKIMDDEYHKAIIARPPTVTVPAKSQSGGTAQSARQAKYWRTSAAMVLGVGIGIIVRSRSFNRRR